MIWCRRGRSYGSRGRRGPIESRNLKENVTLEALTFQGPSVFMQKMTQPLSDTETEVVLSSLPGWVAKDDQLVKTFVFGSFREAMSFIVRISYEAEDMNHHPEITNVYNRVAISLTTHDAGGRITERDAKLARKIENISWLT